MHWLTGWDVEHEPSGRTGRCWDQWLDPRLGWYVRIMPKGQYGSGFNVPYAECRILAFKPYLVWSDGRRVA